MVNPLIVKRKLGRLTGYLEELESLSLVTLDEYLADHRQRRAVERLIQLVVDAAVDINTHIAVDWRAKHHRPRVRDHRRCDRA